METGKRNVKTGTGNQYVENKKRKTEILKWEINKSENQELIDFVMIRLRFCGLAPRHIFASMLCMRNPIWLELFQCLLLAAVLVVDRDLLCEMRRVPWTVWPFFSYLEGIVGAFILRTEYVQHSTNFWNCGNRFNSRKKIRGIESGRAQHIVRSKPTSVSSDQTSIEPGPDLIRLRCCCAHTMLRVGFVLLGGCITWQQHVIVQASYSMIKQTHQS